MNNSFDIILTGHEHRGYAYSVDANCERCFFVEGGKFYHESENLISEFNILHVDFESNNIKFKRYQFTNEKQYYKVVQDEHRQLTLNNNSIEVCGKLVRLREDASRDLHDSGAPYKHPYSDDLSFVNIFIFPDVEKMALINCKKSVNPEIESMEAIIQKNTKILFLGSEKSGKTSCCKKIFLDSISNKKIPVWVKVNEKNSISNTKDFDKEILKSTSFLYPELEIEAFIQTSPSNKVIIIDDFHLINVSGKIKSKILNDLFTKYENIIVFCDESSQYDLLVINYVPEKCYTVYTILPFGHIKRDQLIRKWYEGMKHEDYDEYASEKSVESARAMLDTVVKNGFVPAYPFFLYTALSSHFMTTNGSKIEESKYGSFFTTLLNFAIHSITDKGDEVDLYFNYLTELAFYFFSDNRGSISLHEHDLFRNWYIEEFSLSDKRSNILERLVKAKLLMLNGDSVYFRYKYFYFYFVAKHLTSSLGTPETQGIINRFCDNLHQKISSSVIVFLVHLSKDSLIIDAISSKASKILSETQQATLNHGIDFIEELITELPCMVYDTSLDHVTEKQKILAAADQFEPVSCDSNCLGDKIDGLHDSEAEELSDEPNTKYLCDAFKTIELIGQVMKNYHGSLRATLKDSLCKEAYGLMLRNLNYFLELLGSDRDMLIEKISTALENFHTDSKEKQRAQAQKILFNIASLVSYGFIEKTSSALGSSHLAVTFERTLNQYKGSTNLAVKLIDLAIKFDHQRIPPTEEVKQLRKECERSNVCMMILQIMTFRHLKLFPVSPDIRQKLCDAAKISLKGLLISEMGVKRDGGSKK